MVVVMVVTVVLVLALVMMVVQLLDFSKITKQIWCSLHLLKFQKKIYFHEFILNYAIFSFQILSCKKDR